ncbi:MAG: hypothetical protein K0R14_778 [Burkholderiales bacterium]|jgi:hypothetical protein|nr:hypothetical protein [Burkholderiales bacterium]
MNTKNYEKLASHFKTGHVYKRGFLAAFSNSVDRDLMKLVQQGAVEKIAAGLYYKPAKTRFGALPPNDKELVKCFLSDNRFLLYSWNQYNTLGLGLTQIYNNLVVYNNKRHGMFKLGSKFFDFRRSAHGFPTKIDKEFLLVDLVNNLNELTEDTHFVKQRIKNVVLELNKKKLNNYANLYGKIATKKFFELLNG